jgi:hypothetical protein
MFHANKSIAMVRQRFRNATHPVNRQFKTPAAAQWRDVGHCSTPAPTNAV